jgi:RHS repeat-associated protein
VLSTDDQPILGATVFLDGQTATSDAAGGFLLTGINAGQNRPLSIDGRTASAANRTYPLITEPANIVAGQANQMPFIFYLPPIDSQFNTVVNPNADTVVANPRVPGLQMTIPKGANLRNRDGSPVAMVSITPLPPDRTPAPLPSNVTAQMVYTSQPGGAVSSIAMPVVYPNLAGANPGTRVELYAFNHDTVQWYVYGFGDVSADGRTIAPEVNPATGKLYGLPDFSWHFPNVGQGGNPSPGDSCPAPVTDRPVDLPTGLKIERETDISFGGARGGITLTRVFTTDLAQNCDTCPFGRGWTHSYAARLAGTFQQGGAGRVIMPGEVTGRLFSYTATDPDGALVFITTATIGQLGDKVRKLTDGTFQYRYKHGDLMLFDSSGRLVTLQDRNSNRTVLTYSGGNLTQITDPVGRSVNLAYDSSNRITSATDPIGRVWKYTYEGTPGVLGVPGLTTVTDPLGFVEKYVYIIGGRIAQVIDKRGNVAKTINYDTNGRVATQQFADGGIESYQYNLSGGIVTSTVRTDPMGRVTAMRFNPGGYVISQQDELGQRSIIERDVLTNLPLSVIGPCGCPQVTRTYDTAGNVLKSADAMGQTEVFQYDLIYSNLTRDTDKLGRVTAFGYDTNGNLTTMTRATGSLNLTTTFSYDSFGETTSVSDTLGHLTTFHYDLNGNRASIADPLGETLSFQYDGIGRITSTVDPLGRTGSMSYNALYMIAVTDAAGAVTQFGYDANGNQTGLTDALQNRWSYVYDAKNRLASITDAIARTTMLQYNADDETTGWISPSGRTTIVSYDPRGQVAAVVDPLQGVMSFSYDNQRNLTALKDQRGFTTSFGYDSLFRAVMAMDPVGLSSVVTYDAVDNVTSTVDRLGRQTTMTYDAANRLVQSSYVDAAVSYVYDASSRLTHIDDSAGVPIDRTYDNADRLISETTPEGTVSYSYNAAGQRSSMTVANLPAVSYGYDSAGRLQTIGQGSATFAYSYDALSRTVKLQRPNGVTTSYSYDNVDRLLGLLHSGPGGQAIESLSYAYDSDDEVTSIGSMASAALLSSAQAFGQADPANRIRSFGSVTAQFDGEGQMVSKTDSANSATTGYQWDARGRLKQVTLPGSQTVSYNYDALGRRVSRTAFGVTTAFLYDGQDVVLDRGGDGTSTRYLNGLDIDEKLRQDSGSGPQYFLSDRLGSTIALTDGAGSVLERDTYAPFGATPGSSSTRYGFTGRELDAQTGMMYYRARWYDPALGHFMSEDPISFQGSSNLYEYAADNPTGLADPLGLKPRRRVPSRTRPCTPTEIEQCKRICGPRGMESCRVSETFGVVRWKDGKTLWAWRDGPMSCSCNEDNSPNPECERERQDNRKRVPQNGPTAFEYELQEQSHRYREEFWKWILYGDYLLLVVATGGGARVRIPLPRPVPIPVPAP